MNRAPAGASRPRLALLTAAAWPEGDPDDAHLVRALSALGVTSRWTIWTDPTLEPDAADAFLVR